MKWFRSVTFADNTHEPEGEILLDCSRSRVCRIQEEMSSTYTTRLSTRGMVIHMVRGRETCTGSVVIHKINAQLRGCRGAHQGVLMRAQVVQ